MNPLRLKRSGSPEPLSETAAAWVLRAERGLTETEERKLSAWLAHPEHTRAFDDAVWALDSVQSHAAAPELMALREAALAKAPERSPYWPAAALTGLAAALAGVLLWFGTASDRPASPVAPPGAPQQAQSAAVDNGVYRTGVGERSAVLLPDGSVATLDTDSELRVAYSGEERAVILARGQALFEVAEGQPIPFQVYAGDQRITAVGTTFNVKLHGREVRVSMVEGVVRVRPVTPPPDSGAPVRELTLRAGEILLTAASRPATVRAVDSSQVAAWRGGLLVFEDEKLADAIAEINRYTDKPIRLADPAVGEYRVTGVFKTNDPLRFARAMSEVFPLAVEPRPDGSAVLKAER